MPRTGRARPLAGVALAVALGVLAVGVVVGASDSTFESTTTTSKRHASRNHQEHLSSRERRERFKRLHGEAERCKANAGFPRTQPAEMLGRRSATDTPTSELWPVRNGWVTGDCRRETWVWAGGMVLAEHIKNYRSKGRFVIRRGGFPRPRQYVILDVPESGPLKLINAPLGPDVVTSAQRGELPFTSKRGVTGTLDLNTDTVTLSTGEVIEGQHP